jgi:hypothetical protein
MTSSVHIEVQGFERINGEVFSGINKYHFDLKCLLFFINFEINNIKTLVD